MATPSGGDAIVLSLAGFAATLPSGLQPAPFFMGWAFCTVGVVMRAGAELQKASEGKAAIPPSKLLSWAAGGIFAALGTDLIYLILLQLLNLPANLPELFWLVALSYYGQGATTWLMQTTTNVAKGVLGGVFKGFPTPKDDQP